MLQKLKGKNGNKKMNSDSIRHSGKLTIEIRCPHCGGNDAWMELQRLKKCSFCGSTLYLEQEKAYRFYLEPTTATADEARQVIVHQKATRLRSESMARWTTNAENPELDIMRMIPVSLEPFLRTAEQSIHLLRRRLIFVPYRHLQATFYQTLLAKEQLASYALRRVLVDEALPAYKENWNFRDRGLKFGEAKVKETTRRLLSDNVHLPARGEIEEHIIRNYPPAEGKKFYQFKSHTLCHRHATLIFRPYWIAEYRFQTTEYALIDATFGTVAGYPDANEFERWYSYMGHPHANEDLPAIQIVSSRCPVCGYDSEWEATEVLRFCKNCGRALSVEQGRLRTVSYSFVPPAHDPSVQIPFWSFPVRLRYQDQTYSMLQDYYRLFFMERLLKDCRATDRICIPATDIRRMRKGDQFFSALVADASSFQGEWISGPLAPPVEIYSGRMSSDSAAELLSILVPVVSSVHPGMHKSGTLTRMLNETSVDYEHPSLVVLSYPVEGQSVIVGKKRFPLPFLND